VTWAGILVLAAGAYLFKALGLLVLGPHVGRRSADGLALRFVNLLPAALLAALVAVQTLADGDRLLVDARLAGVVAGGAAVLARAPFVVVIVVAAATTAVIRAV
jgi:branched chain amino acid efflux pump